MTILEYIREIETLNIKLAEKNKEIEGLKIKLETANNERHEEWKTGKEWKWEWQKVNRQLAEMTKKYNTCQEARKLEAEFSQQDKKELIQQLAEKEKEIETNKNALKKLIKNCDTVKCENKIAFTIEKLEKVKHYAQHIQGGLIDYIDNQIKQLKEGK